MFWAYGSFLETSERVKLEEFVQENCELKLPTLKEKYDTIYNYNVNPHTGEWTQWKEALYNYTPPEINPSTYGDLLIPNVSSIRTEFIINVCAGLKKNILLTGEQGSAKTSIINNFITKLDPEKHMYKKSNFSATTTPQMFQKTIEGSVDKELVQHMGLQ